jgi:hypothetical protein
MKNLNTNTVVIDRLVDLYNTRCFVDRYLPDD